MCRIEENGFFSAIHILRHSLIVAHAMPPFFQSQYCFGSCGIACSGEATGFWRSTAPYRHKYFLDQTESITISLRKPRMYQPNPNRLEDHKKRTTFVVVGGVVACVTALAVVLGLKGVKTVRLGDESHSHDGASFSALLTANASGSNDSVSSPTTTPSVANSNILPTSKPTQQLRKYSPSSLVQTAPATRELNLFLDEKVRMKLYWEVGYYWQEETVEKW